MAFELWMIGKTKEAYLQTGIDAYTRLVSRYLKIESAILPDPKHAAKLDVQRLKKEEASQVLKKLKPSDYLILLHEHGKNPTSRQFASVLENRMNDSGRRTIFLIGGAYGFDASLLQRSNQKLSLSNMTFSHQLIRLIFWEQLYRGVAIINRLPYHND
ncbi:MAG: 23S rRNA (pseudouridine(1915)-N(3))-methyltransferase RlmH [Bacteroidetes bacterium]|nr:23S rRNA (pseudouridine(1915)-N(3))-methyltransferase RlmH [Bacteroidota bacterium]